ncbi:MAG: toluene tolerance protein [Desulfobacteraceae bacterium]|nr:MAG: toluene tolerance protein [Desulfobacteraceae bacterium]
MKNLSYEKYLALRDGAEILASDSFGEKVLRLKDGSITKLFRTKRIISSALFYPYAIRFVKNAAKLKGMGISTVTIIDSYKIPAIKRTAVHYMELEGETLRNHIMHYSLNCNITQKLATFIARLHNEGVYFRSIHFGNILITPDNSFGLIDIADMKISTPSLNIGKRIRNFHHMTRYETDRNSLKQQKEIFIMEYIKMCNFQRYNLKKLKEKISSILS